MTLTPLQLPTDCGPTLRVRTRPNDANPGGDIFGGWLMSQIDIAGAIVALERSKGPVATVAVQSLTFLKPLFVHDLVSFYAKVVAVGKTSMTVQIETYSQRMLNYPNDVVKISEATFIYVAVSKPGEKRVIPL